MRGDARRRNGGRRIHHYCHLFSLHRLARLPGPSDDRRRRQKGAWPRKGEAEGVAGQRAPIYAGAGAPPGTMGDSCFMGLGLAVGCTRSPGAW